VKRMFEGGEGTVPVFGKPQELRSCPDDCRVVRTHLLTAIKHYELGKAKWRIKCRFVGLGDRIFNRWMKLLRLPPGDFWAPVTSLTGARLVHARSTAAHRLPDTIDLVSAYLQAPMGGEHLWFAILEPCVIKLAPPELRRILENMEQPVVPIYTALYGIGRSGMVFIIRFRNWLLLNRWISSDSEPALYAFWRDEAADIIFKRGPANLEYVKAQEKLGNDILGWNPTDVIPEQTEPWATVLARVENYESDLEARKGRCSGSKDCAAMVTYSDDCEMDGEAADRELHWRVIKILFESGEASTATGFLGMQPRIYYHGGSDFVTELSQEEYIENMCLEYAQTHGETLRKRLSVGSTGKMPDLPEDYRVSAPTISRSSLGGEGYAVQCTRPEVAMCGSRLQRFADK